MYLGDHVIEQLFARCEFWKERLDRTRGQMEEALDQQSRPTYPARARMFDRTIDVQARYEAVRQDWLVGNAARLRKACLVLLQTYAAYHPVPCVPWLGVDANSIAVQGSALRIFFRRSAVIKEIERRGDGRLHAVGERRASLVDVQVIRQVAAALEDVTAIYERGVQPDDLLNEAKDQFDLAVMVNPRMVFWKGLLLDLPWNKAEKSWNLMLHLAVKAEGKLPLHDFALTGANDQRAQTVRKSHLVELLSRSPVGAELSVRIEKPRGGDCRLAIEPSQVKVLDLNADEWNVDASEFASG